MDEQLQQQIVQLVQAAMQGNQQANQQIQQIAQAAQQGDLQAAQLFQVIQQVAKQMQGGARSAKNGAKLQYVKKLKNICNEGEELVFMKKGGKACPVCMKKKINKKDEGGPISPVKSFKQKYQDKKKKEIPYDKEKHERLVREFQRAKKDANNSPIGWSKAKIDSLAQYNMKDPNGDEAWGGGNEPRYNQKKK